MSKSFYVVCRQSRIYSSRQEFNVASFEPIFGSSDYEDISERVNVHNKELDILLNSDFIFFPFVFDVLTLLYPKSMVEFNCSKF